MSLLEAYVNDDNNHESVESVRETFRNALECLKTYAQSMPMSCVRFEYAMANVCLEAHKCLTHIETSLHEMTLFIENSIKKWNAYTLVYKEMLKVITMVTQPVRVMQHAQNTQSSSYLPRMNKLPSNIVFNVIQINAPFITMRCENKAIVKGLNPRPLLPPVENEAGETKPYQYDLLFRSQLEELAKNVITVFEAEKHKKQIYMAHYERLGNLNVLGAHIERLLGALTLLEGDENISVCVTQMRASIEEMPRVMRQTKENCKDYVFNTVNRFTECGVTYECMLREISARHLEFEEMRDLEECQELKRPEKKSLFSAMY